MALCPKDFKPCIDDLCYGGGCLRMPGASILHKCDGCGDYHGDDEVCEGDFDEDDVEWDEDE